VRGTVAQRDEGDGQLEAVKQQIRDSREWFNTVVPSHINPDQFVALGIGVLSRDPQLAEVAKRNPQSFMVALSECARLGLIPGDGYALTYFGSNIVGIVEYTGELELIYRTGRVRTVCAEIVWTRDRFSRGAHPHDPPVFAPAGGGRFPKESERGEAEGGFAYAVFPDGTNSRVIYMSADEIGLHRKAARNKNVWDGDFWRSMWLKTLVHELYKWVPKSAEFLGESMRVLAAGDLPGAPAVGYSPPPAQSVPQERHHASSAAESAWITAIQNGEPDEPPDGPQVPARHSPAEGGGKVNPAVLKAITGLLDEFGCTDRNDRMHAVSVLGHHWVDKPGDMSALEGEQIMTALQEMRASVPGNGEPPAFFAERIPVLAAEWERADPEGFRGET